MRRALLLSVMVLAGCGESAAPPPSPTPTPIALVEPFDVVEERGGTFLIADRGADAVYRERAGKLTLVAALPAPRDLEPDGDRVLVASAEHVVALDPRTGATETVATADAEVLGVARTDDGIAYTQGTRVMVGERVIARGLDGVHGLLDTPRGLVICESTTGRVLLGRRVLARGLDLPSFAAPAPDGGLYVTEFGAGRVAHIDRSGRVRPVADVANPAALSVAVDGTLLVASLGGEIVRVRI